MCDAYDAMANTRQYRQGMGHDRALAILREHAGSQWDPVVVDHLTTMDPAPTDSRVLGSVGRQHCCDCIDALPERIRLELSGTNG